MVRDLDQEGAQAAGLVGLGFQYNPENHQVTLDEDKLLNVVPELFERHWLITGKGIPFRPPTDMEVDIKTEPDLIELEVTVHFDDLKVGLPALISAIKDDSRWVTLGKGQIGVLPFEWLEKNAPWLEM